MTVQQSVRPYATIQIKCLKCGKGMQIIHGDCRTCCLHLCDNCGITYRYCVGKVDQICPPQ